MYEIETIEDAEADAFDGGTDEMLWGEGVGGDASEGATGVR